MSQSTSHGNGANRSSTARRLVHKWDYLDREGTKIGEVRRYETEEGKEIFPYFKPDTDGDFLIGGADKPRPLYCAPAAFTAPTVFIVEGEKCVEALRWLGIPAATSPNGAQAAKDADWSVLPAQDVYLLPDQDDPGEHYIEDVARMIAAVNPNASFFVVRLPGLGEKEDVVDWILAHELTNGWTGFEPVPDAAREELKRRLLSVVEEVKEPYQLRPAEAEPDQKSEAPDPHVEKIRNALLLSEVLRHFNVDPTGKQKRGGWVRIRSPFNPDSDPSFEYNDTRKCFHCFSSGKKGDAFTLIAELGGFKVKADFPKVLAIAEQISGVEPELEPKVNALRVAKDVYKSFGEDNIVYAQSRFWVWEDRGVWRNIEDRAIQQRILKIAGGASTRAMIDAALDLLKTLTFYEGLEFNQHKTICCLNGELSFDGAGWQLLPFDKRNFCTCQIPVEYDPAATAPRFDMFLDEIFEPSTDEPDGKFFALSRNAPAKRRVVLEMLGYSLTTETRFEKFLVLKGEGSNGKSVLLGVLENLIGRENCSAVCPTQFSNRFQRAFMHGKLCNVVSELPEGGEISDGELKALCSGELVVAERKFCDPFAFRPTAKIIFATNHMPRCRDYSSGIARRALVLDFPRNFEKDGADVYLGEKLKQELPGILNMALQAYGEVLRRSRFTECEESKAAVTEWRKEADSVAQFVEERCDLGAGKEELSSHVFNEYRNWCNDSAIKSPLNRNNFTSRLRRFGVEPEKGTAGTRKLRGIELRA